MTARARLAAVYVVLVVAAGAVVVGLTYVLVRSRTATKVTIIGGPGPPPVDVLPDLDRMREDTLDQLLVQSLIALGVVVVLAAVVGWLVAGRLLRPIRAISQTAQRVSAAERSTSADRIRWSGTSLIVYDRPGIVYDVPADHGRRPDELTALADTINGMLDRVQDGIAERDRLLERHKLFVANAAHELRTPLATMRTAIDVTLDGDPSSAELHAMITDVSSAVDASRRTLDGLLALARSQAGSIRREPADLATIAAGVIEHADYPGFTIRTDLDPAPVSGEASLLQRLAANLIDNAIRYNHPNGLVEVRTWTDDHTANLRITNTGQVVPPGDLARLFQPFVRGSGPRVRAGGGAGLGLSIVDAITTAHDGAITSTAPASGGLDITVSLPRLSAAHPQLSR